MKILSAYMLMICFCTLVYANDSSVPDPIIFNLSNQDILQIKAANISRKSFENDWGQFEVLIVKNRFPIPAPNCRSNIILRMPGIAPDAPDRRKQLDIRWYVFQSLLDLKDKKIDQFEVVLSNKHYMKFDGKGKPYLQYCNAYFATNFSEWKKLILP